MEFEFYIYAILFLVAFFGGFVDAIAGGGGLITVPALMAVGIPPHVALATNKLQGCFGTFTAALNFSIKGMVDYKEIFIGIISTFIGTCIGTWLILILDASVLKVIIPFLLVCMFIYTLFSPKVGESDRAARMKKSVFYMIFGLLFGFYDGFFGPGAGAFWTFGIVALIGLNMKKAVAHTKVLNFISNFVSLVVFIIGGQILWVIGILMGVGQILGAYAGSNLAIKKDVKFIRTMFLCVVAATIVKMIWDFLK